MSGGLRSRLHTPAARSLLLFVNFFLIILAYYQVKPASRSLFLEYGQAADLPYLWAGSAALMLLLMPLYQRLVDRHRRWKIVLATCGIVIGLLVIFRILLLAPGFPVAVAFYLLVDIFSVVLVEQFWSLTNSVYDRKEGRRWYGLIASGGLLGGLAGGALAGWLVEATPLQTTDMLLVAAAILVLMIALTVQLGRYGVYREIGGRSSPVPMDSGEGWRAVRANPYLMMIALMLLFSQMCEPIIEYQFMRLVEQSYTDAESRTAFLSNFLSLLNGVALVVNLLLTPIILRRAGAVGALMVQPVLLGLAALNFSLQARLSSAALMKICDRGLAYSINRSARELIYVRADPVTIYRAKAWIDMVGYRAFKITGSAAILLLTQWLPWRAGETMLSVVVLVLCVAWVFAAFRVGKPPTPGAQLPLPLGRDSGMVES